MGDRLKKHILVITQYFYPEQFRINDICTEWVKRGYKVTVITGIPNYPQGKYYDGYGLFKKRKEEYNGMDIIRIPLIPRGNNAIMLTLNYLSFVVSGFFWKVFTKIKADYVFIFEVSPMTQALPGVWYAGKRKVPCYLYVQDLWPENVEKITGITNKEIIGAIGKMVDYINRGCTKIFTTSESFVKSIHDRGVPLDKIEYWPQYAEDFYIPIAKMSIPEIPKDERLNIIFAGNIGYFQGLDVLIKTAEVIKKEYDMQVRFNIIGDGRYKEEFKEEIIKNQLDDMFNFIQQQPARKIPKFLASCDLAFLSLASNPLTEMTIPAKLQTYMACGITILASVAGEAERIIVDSNSGLCSQPGDELKLAKNIYEFYKMEMVEKKRLGTNARNYYCEMFSKEKLLSIMDEYFNR